VPGHRLHIQDLALRISPSLHPPIVPAPTPPTRARHTDCSAPSKTVTRAHAKTVKQPIKDFDAPVAALAGR
jgi:hypothetical protein